MSIKEEKRKVNKRRIRKNEKIKEKGTKEE